MDSEYSSIDNCPILREDIDAVEDKFGTNLGSLIGKQTRRATKHARTRITQLPPSIFMRYKHVCIAGDIMTINGLSFLTTISTNIMFRSGEYIMNTKAKSLINVIKDYKTSVLIKRICYTEHAYGWII